MFSIPRSKAKLKVVAASAFLLALFQMPANSASEMLPIDEGVDSEAWTYIQNEPPRSVGENKYGVWITVCGNESSKTMQSKFPIAWQTRNPGFNYYKTFNEFDLANKLSRMTQMILYDKNGRVIASRSFETKWEHVVPDAVEEAEFDWVVKNHPTVDPVEDSDLARHMITEPAPPRTQR